MEAFSVPAEALRPEAADLPGGESRLDEEPVAERRRAPAGHQQHADHRPALRQAHR